MEKKKNIFVRFANVWYYYKFYVLIGIILIIALIVGINSCFFRESYDLSILYITSEDTDRFSHSEDVLNKIETFVSDINGDGKANAEIITISYGQTQAEQQSAAASRAANIAYGKALFYILDEQNYQQLKEGGFLEDISTLGQSQYLEQYRFCINDSKIFNSIDGFSDISEKYYFCIRTYDKSKAENEKNFQIQYDSAVSTLTKIINEYK